MTIITFLVTPSAWGDTCRYDTATDSMVPTIKNDFVVKVEVAANLAEVSKLGPIHPQKPKAGWTGKVIPLMDGSNFYYFSGKVASIRVHCMSAMIDRIVGRSLLKPSWSAVFHWFWWLTFVQMMICPSGKVISPQV